jgi:hypothetical protein
MADSRRKTSVADYSSTAQSKKPFMTAGRGLPALPQSEKVGRARVRRWSSDIFTVLKNNPEGIG